MDLVSVLKEIESKKAELQAKMAELSAKCSADYIALSEAAKIIASLNTVCTSCGGLKEFAGGIKCINCSGTGLEHHKPYSWEISLPNPKPVPISKCSICGQELFSNRDIYSHNCI